MSQYLSTLGYIPIDDTSFKLVVFWPPDTRRIRLTFSESVSRLMPLLTKHAARNVKSSRVITFQNGISFKKKRYNQQNINTFTWSAALYLVLWIFPCPTHHTQRFALLVILWSWNIHSTWYNASNQIIVVTMYIDTLVLPCGTDRL